MIEIDQFETHVWSFLKEYQQRIEMGENDIPYPSALDYIQRHLSSSPDKVKLLERIIEECSQAERGTYSNINRNDSLIKQLKLAADELFESR